LRNSALHRARGACWHSSQTRKLFADGAVINLETTIAIQRAAATGNPIRLPLET
jgi:hypothetical protein